MAKQLGVTLIVSLIALHVFGSDDTMKRILTSKASVGVYGRLANGPPTGSLIADARADRFAIRFVEAVESARVKDQSQLYSQDRIAFGQPVWSDVFTVNENGIRPKEWQMILSGRTDFVFAQLVTGLLRSACMEADDTRDPHNLELVSLTETVAISVEDFMMLKNVLVDPMVVESILEDVQVYVMKTHDKYKHAGTFYADTNLHRVQFLAIMIAVTETRNSIDAVSTETRDQLLNNVIDHAAHSFSSEGEKFLSEVYKLAEEPVEIPSWAFLVETQSDKSAICVGDVIFGILANRDTKALVHFKRTNSKTGQPSYYALKMSYLMKRLTYDAAFKLASSSLASVYGDWKTSFDDEQIRELASANSQASQGAGISILRSNSRFSSVVGGRFFEPYATISAPLCEFVSRFLFELWAEVENQSKNKFFGLSLLTAPASRKMALPVGHTVVVAYRNGYFYAMKLSQFTRLPSEFGNERQDARKHLYLFRIKASPKLKGTVSKGKTAPWTASASKVSFADLREFPTFERYSVSTDLASNAMKRVHVGQVLKIVQN